MLHARGGYAAAISVGVSALTTRKK